MSTVLYDVPGPKARRLSRVIGIVAALVVLAGLAWVIVSLALPRTTASGAVQPGLFDGTRWDIFNDRAVWRTIGGGYLNTLKMAGLAAVLAIVIGVLFSFARTARLAVVRVPATVVLEFFRGMPVLLMMLFILLVFSSGAYWAGVWALAIYNGALIGEILRAGIAALPRGQREAGLTIGLTPLRTRFLIEFPQAARNMLPIIIAQLVVLLKDTALAYVIGYSDLLRLVKQFGNFYGNRYTISMFLVVLAIYLIMNLLLSWVARIVARRTGPKAGTPSIPGRGIFGRRRAEHAPAPGTTSVPDPLMGNQLGGGAGPPL
ncbi:MAG TPA: amino acid ABC transporter permease [Pseudolysinimonas sp.]|nr:amino acid ABC transporter permease [Pseudolysinimonas sp.]